LAVSLTPSAGYGLFAPATAIAGEGRLERFPEAGAIFYTAKLSAPPSPGGPCGDEPVSLALSLQRQGESPRVTGGLTAYCGAGRWYGVPKRVLRITGSLSRPE
jgi:hypothetical protein